MFPPFRASLVAQLVKNPPAMQETWFDLWVGKIPSRRERLPTLVFWPDEFQGLYSPWGHKKSDTNIQFHIIVLYNIPIGENEMKYIWNPSVLFLNYM